MNAKNPHFSHLLEINLAMLFISTSGALGRYILLSVPVTIATRAILSFGILLLYCKFKGFSLKVEDKDLPMVIFAGFLMGLHWITYFYALQMSNVAIGMLSLFTYPVWTALLEPVVLKTKFQKIHLLLGALVLCGIYFLIPDFNLENSYTIAIGMGVFSALVYAFRNLIMKPKVGKYNGSLLMSYQTGIVGVMLLPALFFTNLNEVLSQWEALVTLALLTTAIGHTLFLLSLKHFTVTTASILSSAQPVYGIIIGMIFLSEFPSWSTVFGGVLILTAVVVESVRTYR
ncbi:DMT family transporter [Maribacter sp. 2308TA10-17]|uniref:DMT family transporter n=1 Tax=Maribacter sp. 2308TA10-17 TaxID=3386276 RepID=UPI0039BD7595